MRTVRDHIRVYTPIGSKNPTQQHFRDQCTVSKIVKRFQDTGILPQNSRQPLYGDFSESTDLHHAMNLVETAQADYDALAPHIRAASGNDPRKFLEMLATEEGCELLEASGLDLLPDPPSEATPKIPVSSEGVPAPSELAEKEEKSDLPGGTT